MPTQEESESLRSVRNEYDGLASGPLKRTGPMRLRLDFNPHIYSAPGMTRIDGFSLRIMERPEDVPFPEKRGEYSVQMTVEQWQDLISAMQEELRLARETRDEFEKLNPQEEDWEDI